MRIFTSMYNWKKKSDEMSCNIKISSLWNLYLVLVTFSVLNFYGTFVLKQQQEKSGRAFIHSFIHLPAHVENKNITLIQLMIALRFLLVFKLQAFGFTLKVKLNDSFMTHWPNDHIQNHNLSWKENILLSLRKSTVLQIPMQVR